MDIPPEVVFSLVGTADAAYVYERPPFGEFFGVQSVVGERVYIVEMPVHMILAMHKAGCLRRYIVFQLSAAMTKEMFSC